MRTKNSLLNMIVPMIMQGINVILLFISRKIFIQYFAEEYLGVNGLFTEILTVFSLAELGIGVAMAYGLYGCVARKEEAEICRLMNLYRRLYTIVGLAVAVVGLAILPFLDVLIKDNNIPHITGIYLMYLANSVLSYFLSYKQTLIQADQKNYIVSGVTQAVRCAQVVVQIILIITTKNFYLYLAAQMAMQVLTNYVLALVADRMYPYLVHNKYGLPQKEKRKEIFAHIKAMSFHKFGAVFVSNTDNLILSMFVGLKTVGLYSNYRMITTNVRLVLSYVYNAFTASIGNLVATESPKRVLAVYRSLNFMMSILYGWLSVCLYVLINPFIGLFFGEKYRMSAAVVVVIVIDFYITGMRQMTLRFRDAMGLYWHDRYKPIPEVLINLVVSLLLVTKYDVVGVLAGTIVSSLATNFWIEPYVFCRYGIKENWKKIYGEYYIRYGIYTLVTIVAGALGVLATCRIPDVNFFWWILKAVLISAIYGLLILVLFFRTPEFRFLVEKIMELLHKRRHRIEKASD